MTRVQLPSTASVSNQVDRFVELWLDAMFLKPEGYAYERDQKNPFGNGLVYIAMIGVLVAAAGILGSVLRYAVSPSADAVKNTVLVHLQSMPFYLGFDSAMQTAFDRGYDQTWNMFGSTFLRYPTNITDFISVALSALTIPLGLVIGWIVYGALVHLIARGWNPETSFGELLAPLALATSPQILNVFAFFPMVGLSGAVISLWTLICNVIAIRIAYQTTTRRAVWAALFPILVLAVVLILLAVAAAAFLVPLSRAMVVTP